MPGRDLIDDATRSDLVGNLSTTPLADRATGRLRRLAGQSDNLADLLGGDVRRGSWSGRIRQALLHGEILQRHRLQPQPAGSPQTNGLYMHPQLASDLGVVSSVCGSHDDACSYGNLLGCRVTPNQGVQLPTFLSR